MIKSVIDELPDILLEENLITPEQRDEAFIKQQEKGEGFGRTLVALGFLDEIALLACIAERLNIPPIDLTKFRPLPEVVELVPRQIANYYQILPLADLGKTLSLAMVDPLNVLAIDDIKLVTGLEVQPVMCTEKDFLDAVDKVYTLKADMENLIASSSQPGVILREEDELGAEINVEDLIAQSGAFSIITVVEGELNDSSGKSHPAGSFLMLPKGDEALTASADCLYLQTTIPK